MLTRRQLLALLPAAALQPYLRAQLGLFSHKPKPQPAAQPFVFFGTDTTRPAARGIYLARFDTASGHFTDPALAAACVRPSYFAINHVRSGKQTSSFLYAINAGNAQTSGVTSYRINPLTGELDALGQVSSGGEGPCYIALDAEGRSAYVANYNSGTIATCLIQPGGTLSAPVDRIDFHNARFGHHGPVAGRQDGPHPHSAMFSPDDRFLIVNDLGNDDIVIFPVNPATAHLGAPGISDMRLPGSGPRHLAFHPNGRWVYGIDELSNRIDQYLWTSTRGSSSIPPQAYLSDTGNSLSTLDPGFHGANTAAEVVVDSSGSYVYASNRGENSLVLFTVDQTNGALTFAQRISCGGKGPRHFTLDPSGKWLICANQDSASVTVFLRNLGDGHLSGPVQTLAVESPMFTLFA